MRFVQLTCMLFGLTSQYFTGDTLVSAEYGLTPIADIEAGDSISYFPFRQLRNP